MIFLLLKDFIFILQNYYIYFFFHFSEMKFGVWRLKNCDDTFFEVKKSFFLKRFP